MLRRYFSPLMLALLIVVACYAGELQPIALPAPQTDAGKPLMNALRLRQSSREFSGENLPLQVLSNLLWAASGVNRPDAGKRTAPSASNRQELDVYVATAGGVYLYEAKEHRLQPVLADDIRAQTGTQAYVREAPVNLVYVADFARMGSEPVEDKIFYSACDTGFVSQNVYLYSASEGLATVVRGSVDRSALAKAMKLRADQRITLAQSVGYPKK
ncbi:MAG: SagB/ThcOx family dehydrogenase [Acidobacteriia bacterium]|nr:SagB/ThcOx family dehydrogenase [Terriglobia bacterium]